MRWLNTKVAADIGELYLGGVITYIEACERIAVALGVMFPHVRHAGTMKKFNEHLEYCVALALPKVGDGENAKPMEVQLVFVDAQLIPSGIVVSGAKLTQEHIHWEPAERENYCVDSGLPMQNRFLHCMHHKNGASGHCYWSTRDPRCTHSAWNFTDYPTKMHMKCVDCGRHGQRVKQA